MEPNLQELKEQVMKEESVDTNGLKVKLFRVVGNNNTDAKPILEQEINEFIKNIAPYNIDNISMNVVKNFLPQTTMGEYQEVWYGMVTYQE